MKDLIKGRLFFSNNRHQDKPKPFLHSNFLKVYFHNKGIELVQLNKILKQVNSCIPRTFSSTDNPTVIYKRFPTIARKIFNYKNVIILLILMIGRMTNPALVPLQGRFRDPHKHITGDLKIIEN